MSMYNFWIMDIAVSGLTLLSAFYGHKKREEENSGKTSLQETVPPFSGPRNEQKELIDAKRLNLPWYLVLNFSYFTTMALTVSMLQYLPAIMIGLQHIAVVGILIIAFNQWIPGKSGYIAGSFFVLLWMASAKTAFRWIINNIIVAMFAVLASHIQFRNFAFLQIFLWTAFFYDVFLLGSMGNTPQLFSITECNSLLCKLFEMNDAWQLPAVFTVQFGDTATHVFLGTGDIVIGALISNFSMSFFKSFKCLLLTVSSYGLAIALLSRVNTNQPFPALLSIVPCCSLSLILCAIFSRKTHRLFSMNHRDVEGKDDELLVI
ncbi:uncharacterized protein LOC110234400 [Exaiptasia diaphana]|uniref:Uncharacterized protein n=1 Tax=Exaiptasia diaphana TaxID=2652724 RepID=A0A913WX99_EXADI|nr:uncharacterized protein LOC110234400 [Exaiptasia diaphana]